LYRVVVMAVMAMVHVPSLVVTKSSAAYHHQLGKRTAAAAAGGGLVETQSLRMVVKKQVGGMRRSTGVVCAFGDVSAEGTNYLIAGAVAIAIVGTALPILFSRKDLCPECDGAGFVRKPGTKLNANAARKDLTQIVCKRCNGLGKIGQIDKA
jgi:DnaJ-class molecular chaperone